MNIKKDSENTMAAKEPEIQIQRILDLGPGFHEHLSIMVKSLHSFRLQVPYLQSKKSDIHLQRFCKH